MRNTILLASIILLGMTLVGCAQAAKPGFLIGPVMDRMEFTLAPGAYCEITIHNPMPMATATLTITALARNGHLLGTLQYHRPDRFADVPFAVEGTTRLAIGQSEAHFWWKNTVFPFRLRMDLLLSAFEPGKDFNGAIIATDIVSGRAETNQATMGCYLR